jgi:uncharacterized delta-60 repeat protein
LALALSVGASAPSAAPGAPLRPGTLDRSFGHGGRIFAKAPPGIAGAGFGSAELQDDGRLVVELSREVPEREGRVREIERRLPNGELDPSFGKDGRVRVGGGKGLAVRPDGSILVATASCGPEHGSFVLLDRSGNRLTGFGREGCGPPIGFSTPFIAVAPGGTIYVAGPATLCPCGAKTTPRFEPAVARLLPDGTPDPSFGNGGVVHLQADLKVPSESLESRDTDGIEPTADGGVVVAAGDLLVELGPGGALAPGFGNGGQVQLGAISEALTQLPDGKLVVVAAASKYSFQKPAQMIVARYLPDGTPDTSFGAAGKLEPPRLSEASVVALAPAPREAVLMAGQIGPGKSCSDSCYPTIFAGRVGSDGQLDPTYGNQGLAELPRPQIPEYATRISGLAVSAKGMAIMAGAEYSTAAFAFALTPAGTLDQGFGEAGALVERYFKPPNLETSGIALGPKGQITVAVEGEAAESEFGGFLIAFRRAGRQSQGTYGGVTPTTARGKIVPTRGGFVSLWEQGEAKSGLVAVRRDGQALRRYGDKGIVDLPKDFEPRAIEPGPASGVIVLGSVGEGRKMAIYRVGPRGRPVRHFGHRGLVKLGFGRDGATAFAATRVGGGLVVTGWVGGHTGAAKLLPNGRLDRRFGHRGLVRGLLGKGDHGTQIASLSGGVVIGATAEIGAPKFSGLVRLDRRGRVVHRFGHKGVVPPKVDGRLLGLFTHRGRIVVVSDNEYARHSRGGVELRAYRPNGSPDPGYGRRGLATGGIGQRRFFHPVAAALQPDGKIVVAGAAWNGEMGKVELMRFR